MAMCTTCQGKYNQYSSLAGSLSSALDQTEECKTQTDSAKNSFSTVIIDGVSIDKDDGNDILRRLSLIVNDLSTMITQCNYEMDRIKSACPGSNHYKKYKVSNVAGGGRTGKGAGTVSR